MNQPSKAIQLKKIRQNLMLIKNESTPAMMAERMRGLCNDYGYDPVFEILDLIKNGVTTKVQNSKGEWLEQKNPLSIKDLKDLHMQMMKYLYPLQKAIDITGTVEANIAIVVKNYDAPVNCPPEAIDAKFSVVHEVIERNLEEIKKKAVADA